MSQPTAAFIINLVQDVNILRPLVIMATRDFGYRAVLLVTAPFAGRDLYGIWRAELDELVAATGARLVEVGDDFVAAHALGDQHGLIFAGSESALVNHAGSHDLLRLAPPGFARVTLQHGFECVGFRHSAAHARAHGPTVSFAADIVCGWSPPSMLPAAAPSQQPKMLTTGPTSLLQMPVPAGRADPAIGLVCENLHSVRFRGDGDFKAEFTDAFAAFCASEAEAGREVALRPHPGGQYVLKNQVALPANAVIDNVPMYRDDLSRYAFGLSAPSSVIIDMLLAGIPTAVWGDGGGAMDHDHYAGLTHVSTPAEWSRFAESAIADPAPFVALQQAFLERTGMPTRPEPVYEAFARLFAAAARRDQRPLGAVPCRERILFVSNARLPTLQVCLEQPLHRASARGEVRHALLVEKDIVDAAAKGGDEAVRRTIAARFDALDPTVVILSRYSGPHPRLILDEAERRGLPTIFHVDDDLLGVPRSLGPRKYAYHNAPERLASVRTLLDGTDLVLTSTQRLADRIAGYKPAAPVVAGRLNSSTQVLRPPAPRTDDAVRIGYMASGDHLPNLVEILPAIEAVLDARPAARFELFGSIPIPDALARFGDRVSKAPPVARYDHFMQEFGDRGWHIGICPLTRTDFNRTKANNKWVEYSAVGFATVAQQGMIYDECCADGCGLLVDGVDAWRDALLGLVDDEAARLAMIARAQDKLRTEYRPADHADQIFAMIAEARRLDGAKQQKDSE